MTVKISKTHDKSKVLMKDVYIDNLIERAKEDKRIVVLDADLMNSNGTIKFKKAFPDRGIDVGIQEANMIGMAAGLSATGKIPFTHTFSCFNARRALDQIYLAVSYNKLNVKIVGTDPGVLAAYNGGTHMPLEDVGMMRGIPTMKIIEPTDPVMLDYLIDQILQDYGPLYIRLQRKNAAEIYEKGSEFEIGKGVLVKDGTDLTIIASGIMVEEAIKASAILEGKNISARIVDLFTLKPVDAEIIVESAEKTGAILTAENHNVHNGLASAVSEVLVKNYPVPLEMIGIQDLFGEVGQVDYLMKRFELTAEDIVKKAEKLLARK